MSDGTYGAPITLDKRCSSIELHVTTEAQSLVRSWPFLYDDDGGRGRSLLATIRELGHAADGSVLAAPDRTFAYSVAGPPTMVPVTGWTTPLNDADTDLADLNGDGLPDIVRLGPRPADHAPQPGRRRVRPAAPRCPQAPSPLRLSAPTSPSPTCRATATPTCSCSTSRSPATTRCRRSRRRAAHASACRSSFGQAPAVSPDDPNVRFLDLNGDGLTDVLVDTGRSWLMYLREDPDTWSEAPGVLPPSGPRRCR